LATGGGVGNKTQRLPTYAVVDPRTVVVKLGDTAIADGAVLGADRFMNDARVTELTELERMTFRQIKYHLHSSMFQQLHC